MIRETEIMLGSQSAALNNLSRPDGSAIYSQGDTVMQAATYGPIQARYHKAYVDKAVVEVAYQPKITPRGCKEKNIERILRNTLENVVILSSFPRSVLSVAVQEVQNRGSLLSCSINAACLAIIDSGIPMKHTIAAVDAVLLEDGKIVVNPTSKEEKLAKARFTLAFETVKFRLVTTNTSGRFTLKEFENCVEACRSASGKVVDFYRSLISRRFSKQKTSDMQHEVDRVSETFHKNFNVNKEESEDSD
ncbi:exosome complex component RRP46 [Centruroides vittatus]|uniref:exosome complex component RRP46 n=1 Tax=Centruroides vittatus TaxID=120091 RepID=UPI00350FD69C